MNTNQLLELKDKIARSKQKLAELKGKEEALLEQLNQEFNCQSIKEANLKIQTLDQQLEEVNQKIEDKVNTLKENFPTLFTT